MSPCSVLCLSVLAMFSRNTIQGLSVLLALALLAGQGLLALICILLLLTAGMTRLWDRWSLVRVTYQRELSQPRAFPDDEVELVIRISNRKPLPLVRAVHPRSCAGRARRWSATTNCSTPRAARC